MILIFGGAYQGKLGYAKDNFKTDRIFSCGDIKTGEDQKSPLMYGIDRFLREDRKKDSDRLCIICGLEDFVLECNEHGIEAADWFRKRRGSWQDMILIIEDRSQGIVPVDPEMRAAREMSGRLMTYLASEAEEVHRVFCGIGKRIK